MLSWLFNRKPTKVVLSTDLFFGREHTAFIAACSQYDPTFQARYFDKDNPNSLHGETFWDQDKYNIFYLDIPERSLAAFTQAITKYPCCLYIGKIDGEYTLTDEKKPMFVSPNAFGYNGKLALPYVRRRDARFPLREAAP